MSAKKQVKSLQPNDIKIDLETF